MLCSHISEECEAGCLLIGKRSSAFQESNGCKMQSAFFSNGGNRINLRAGSRRSIDFLW
jgi:hypothetical protein